jgi:creatinine amidohydrolase
MSYPIFDETMVDLTWVELEKKAKENLPVILPISIIEEHGPHMDLAPDVYLVHKLAKEIKHRLKKKQVDSLIAPPMYWGVSKCAESFPGTFSVRPETMIAIMVDLVSCLHKWGFKKIFIVNGHGDYLNIQTIINLRNCLGHYMWLSKY